MWGEIWSTMCIQEMRAAQNKKLLVVFFFMVSLLFLAGFSPAVKFENEL